jgi:hypothetical protein
MTVHKCCTLGEHTFNYACDCCMGECEAWGDMTNETKEK